MNKIDQERKNLVATAVLGTARTGSRISNADGTLRSSVAALGRDAPERKLLDEAALMVNYRRAGMPIPVAQIKEMPIASPESLPQCSPTAGELLKQILGGSHREVLPEALDILIDRRLRVPFLLVPEFLALGAKRTELHSKIARVVGERGKWLAQFNKSWRYVSISKETFTAEELIDEWDSAKVDDRLVIIHRLRELDPNIVVSLIIDSWKSETVATRQAMISVLEPRLSPSDSPILELALLDKSIEVRREAVRLSSKLPLSRIRQKALDVTGSFVQLKRRAFGGSEIILTVPDNYVPEWTQFAIEETSYIKDIGDRAWWLIQWLGFVPPEHWSEKFGMSPPELLAAAQSSDWADTLRLGWSKGAKLTNNYEWNYVLLKYWVSAADSRTTISDLLPRLSDLGPMAEILLCEIIDSFSAPIYDRHPAINLLRQYTGQWSEKFSRKVIDSIERRSRLSKDPNQQIWMTVSLLREFSYRVPPTLANESWFDSGRDSDEWLNWANAVNDFEDTLTFRQSLHGELKS